MVAEAPHSPHVRATARRGSEAILGAFASFVASAQEKGEVNPNLDPDGVAQVMCALYQGLVVQLQVDPEADAARFFEAVMTLFREGLFTRAGLETAPRAARLAPQPAAPA
jgi:hypothetical protein